MNQEIFKNFITNHFKEKLIFFSSRSKKDLSMAGAMFFIQEIKQKDNEEYYVTNKSDYYPNGLVNKKDVIKMLKEHGLKNAILPDELDMYPVGKYMGSTRCRCCGDSLGNGGGCAIFKYENKVHSLSLTGGADHYIKHNIPLNLISYSFIDKEKGIKLHTQFIGNIKDLIIMKEFINQLNVELELKSSKKMRM